MAVARAIVTDSSIIDADEPTGDLDKRSAHAIMKLLQRLNRELSKIVGRFTVPLTVMDAEIWCPLGNLQMFTRPDSLSCVVLTMGDGEFADVQTFAANRCTAPDVTSVFAVGMDLLPASGCLG